MPHVLAVVVAVAAFAALAGCRGSGDPPPCGAVAGNFVLIATTELDRAALDDDTRHAVRDQLPAMRDSIDRACTDTRWSAEVRRCLARAVDHVAYQACQAQLTEEQHRALDRSARGETAPR